MRRLWQIIFSIFKLGWSLLNFIRTFILNCFLVTIIIMLIGIYLHIHHITPELTKGALIMDLNGIIVDKPLINNKLKRFSREFLGISSHRLHENSLFDLVYVLRQAKIDSNITGLVLSLKNFNGADQTSLQYIGKALSEFRDSGKPIYAIGDNYSQAQYFLASYADTIYLTPQGAIDLHGIATNRLYYKSLLDKLKVNSHIFRVGTYKSAVEPFLRDNMSDYARDADSRWLSQLWHSYLKTVSVNRHITLQQLFPGAKEIIAGLHAVNGDTAKFALNNKLVDRVASRSTIDEIMIKQFGWNKQNKSFNAISIYDYHPIPSSQKGDKIAVILANGVISDGLETPGSVGSDTTVSQIRHARFDPNIKAIILRVNSPGGSVIASELIRSELAATRAAGKPIVVSMGGIAASGGYWISTPANVIIASANTITGSIGVFGVINTIEHLLDSIGVHADGVTTSPLADMSITKMLPTELAQMMQLNVERDYKNFINLVAQSRNKSLEEIDAIAQGRVWIGIDALKNGLIDSLGDFDDVVNKAAELAKLKDYQLNWYIDELSMIDILLTKISAPIYNIMLMIIDYWISGTMSQVTHLIKNDASLVFSWKDPQNRYAFCLSCSHQMN